MCLTNGTVGEYYFKNFNKREGVGIRSGGFGKKGKLISGEGGRIYEELKSRAGIYRKNDQI